jgi:hypothetical protein
MLRKVSGENVDTKNIPVGEINPENEKDKIFYLKKIKENGSSIEKKKLNIPYSRKFPRVHRKKNYLFFPDTELKERYK